MQQAGGRTGSKRTRQRRLAGASLNYEVPSRYLFALSSRPLRTKGQRWFDVSKGHLPHRRNNMIRRLIAAATHFDAAISKRLFARKLVLRRETSFLHPSLAYVRIRVERPRGR